MSEESLAGFAASALRAPRKGAFETSLGHYLALSTSQQDPLRQIALITQGALLARNDWKKLKINPETVDILHSVALSLAEPRTYKETYQNYAPPKIVMMISWSIPLNEEAYNQFIKPWWEGHLQYYDTNAPRKFKEWKTRFICERCNKYLFEVDFLDSEKEMKAALTEYIEKHGKTSGSYYSRKYFKCPRCDNSVYYDYVTCKDVYYVKAEPYWSFFYNITSLGIFVSTYTQIKNMFCKWALSHAHDIKAKLLGSIDANEYIDFTQKTEEPEEDKQE
jgi:hypothetical protein